MNWLGKVDVITFTGVASPASPSQTKTRQVNFNSPIAYELSLAPKEFQEPILFLGYQPRVN